MLYTDFCEELNICIDNGDYSSANQIIMHELGQTLVQNKKDFVDLLNQSGVSASINDNDIYLIETFVNNLSINKKLMLGSSLLVNIKNQQSNFNGTQELNDDDVKNGYHAMRTYFIDENYSNAIGLAAVGLATGGVKLADTVSKNKQEKRNLGSNIAAKREESKQAIIQSVIEQKKSKLEQEKQQQDNKLKQQKTIYIIGGSILALTILGIIIYKIKNK
jgi:hypothetical protein